MEQRMPLDLDSFLPPDDPATSHARLARLSFAMQLAGTLADLAHDLRSPLHGLTMAVSLLEQGAEQAAVRDSAGKLMQGATERVEQLLGGLDFPDFSEREPRPLVLGELVERTLTLWPLRPHTKRRPIAVDLPMSLPAVRASDAALRTALLQLLLNACEAQADQETAPVELSAVPDGEWVEICVRDHGPGFAGLTVEEAFQPGVTTRARDAHLGIGLGLARDLLDEIDAGLEVAPAGDGTGVVARLRVPALA
jgi:C4-dicarboxylate-specific signal transduction histidine kinase